MILFISPYEFMVIVIENNRTMLIDCVIFFRKYLYA